MPTPNLAPLMTIPVLGWIAYRRMRGQFGRQPFAPGRQIARLIVFVLAMTGLLFLAFSFSGFGLPIGACLACGALIGVVNLKLTRFEWTPAGDYYYPHPLVGAALSLLLLGRLIYRSIEMGALSGTEAQQIPIAQQSPLTYGVLALLVGYYVAYLTGLLVVRGVHHRVGS